MRLNLNLQGLALTDKGILYLATTFLTGKLNLVKNINLIGKIGILNYLKLQSLKIIFGY